VLGWKDLRQGRGKGRAVGWCLLSSCIFAGADVLIGHWAGPFGRAAFLGTAFTAIGAGSLISYKWLAPGLFAVPRAAWSGTALGAVLMTVNTLAMALCIAGFNDPTGINVVYGTRGLWSLGLVWFVGSRWFGNEERADSKGSMGLRLVGSLLILAAVSVAVAAQGRVG
ncbi:MAG: hypothetical protein JWL81_2186, partial [Verrucomicrobiales bacterium]|nr:hypothetical protein [Verrucomicrobiales bacterium]